MALLDFRGATLSDFLGLRYESEDGRAVSAYAPMEMQRILDRVRLPAARQALVVRSTSAEVEELVGKVARLFERANVTSFDNELGRRRLRRDPNWPLVY